MQQLKVFKADLHAHSVVSGGGLKMTLRARVVLAWVA